MPQPRPLLIGAVAERTGVNIETIRYYERVGLLPRPPRSAGRQRVFEENHVRRLGFIRRSRDLGFPLDRVRTLLELADGGNQSCHTTKSLTLAHLAHVRAKIADLRKLERALKAMTDACRPGNQPSCPILDALGGAA